MDKNVRHHPIGDGKKIKGVGKPNLKLDIHQSPCCVQVFAAKGKQNQVSKKLGVSAKPAEAKKCKSFTSMPIAPGQWMLVAHKYDSKFAQKIKREVEGIGYVSQQDNSRTGVRVSGEKTFELMERLCRLNLRKTKKDFFASTPIGQINALIHHTKNKTFDIYIHAGFGQSFWETITHTASQFGYKVGSR